MAIIRTLDATGSRLTPALLARIVRVLDTEGSVRVINVARGDGDVLLQFGAALERRHRQDWRNRTLTDEEWEALRAVANQRRAKRVNGTRSSR